MRVIDKHVCFFHPAREREREREGEREKKKKKEEEEREKRRRRKKKPRPDGVPVHSGKISSLKCKCFHWH